ncbi:hypothetical protein ASPSYDRAFT_43535 [Aspergillus sydowii CBS 593.65]|uniref:Uncharacterized protein n=1 Tax=Aspergillus sydowii CBS 593.65 TaxID=1036612 RepID=A0A1L9TQB7_9EURO|nr:uncharacterized protein ASPSYDRAFT_43535 [Aspergillus sydowii CBS 593.65]OJJ61627.1 hypothetical protein ASPSYDRAFT_43535 [Aspergillus sydowii CBS 593.65]
MAVDKYWNYCSAIIFFPLLTGRIFPPLSFPALLATTVEDRSIDHLPGEPSTPA